MRLTAKNPVFSGIHSNEYSSDIATYGGVIKKTLLMLLLSIVTGATTVFSLIRWVNSPLFWIFLVVAPIIGMICVFVGRSNVYKSMICTIIYSMCEGVTLGLIVLLCEAVFPGITYLALAITIGIFFASLGLWASKIIKVNGKFYRFLYTFLFGLIISSIVIAISSIFTDALTNLLFGFSGLGLLISFVYLVIGSLILMSHFQEAYEIVNDGVMKEYEWTITLGLVVTIIYIFYQVLEFLIRLLLIFGRDR